MAKKGNGVAPLRPRLQKRFTLPEGCSCREFVMRELDGNDELQIALWVEKKTTGVIANNAIALMKLETRESQRMALVEVDAVAVNVNGIPYAAFDKWTQRTMRFAIDAFGELNGVDMDELKNFRAGAEVVGATTTPAEEDEDDQPTAAPSGA